jgi:hypothetical protein
MRRRRQGIDEALPLGDLRVPHWPAGATAKQDGASSFGWGRRPPLQPPARTQAPGFRTSGIWTSQPPLAQGREHNFCFLVSQPSDGQGLGRSRHPDRLSPNRQPQRYKFDGRSGGGTRAVGRDQGWWRRSQNPFRPAQRHRVFEVTGESGAPGIASTVRVASRRWRALVCWIRMSTSAPDCFRADTWTHLRHEVFSCRAVNGAEPIRKFSRRWRRRDCVEPYRRLSSLSAEHF